MIQTLTRWLQDETTPKEDQGRLLELNKLFGVHLEKVGFSLPYEYIIRAYEDHQKSGLYPNGQARDFQSQALLSDFDTCSLLQERAYLMKKLKLKPADANAPPIPKFTDVFGKREKA